MQQLFLLQISHKSQAIFDRLVLRIRLLTTQSARSSGVSRPKGQRTDSSPIADRVVRLIEQPASAW